METHKKKLKAIKKSKPKLSTPKDSEALEKLRQSSIRAHDFLTTRIVY